VNDALQLELFPVFVPPPRPKRDYKCPPAKTEDEAVMDRALNFVEGQAVLKALLAGKSLKVAFGGPGGSTHPVMWQADAKGIEVHWATENARMIKPPAIVDRARQYRLRKGAKPKKPVDPTKPF